MSTPTVKAAVLRTLVRDWPVVKNHAVASAHPAHPMSGLQRLRELKKAGIVEYRFDRPTNQYVIDTPKHRLEQALERLS